MNVAKTILAQLGNNKFVAMTGAKHFVSDGDSLQFRLPSRLALHGINHVRVTLTPADLYEVVFFKLRGFECTTIESLEGVYAEDLRRVFSEVTGLHCAL